MLSACQVWPVLPELTRFAPASVLCPASALAPAVFHPGQPALALQEEERNRLTLEALDDVTSGQVIDHQAVQAWADSLNTDNPLPVPR